MFNRVRGIPPAMENNLAFPLYGIVGGVVLMIFGAIRLAKARGFRNIPCNPAVPPAGMARQVITGKAHSPASLNAPVSNTACVFYLEKIQASKYSNYGQSGGQEYHDGRLVEAFGGFFVLYGAHTALVVPTPGSCALNKREISKELGNGVQKSEQVITEGEGVTVIGTPRPLREFLAYLRQKSGKSLPSELVAELVKLENDTGYSGTPCFFGDGAERITDQSYEDYLSGTGADGLVYILAGGVIAAAGAAAFFYFGHKVPAAF